MTASNLGDLPDWQIPTAPNILLATSINQGAAVNIVLANALNPIRLWGAWLDVSIASGGTFAGGPSLWGAQLQDENATVLFRVQRHIAVANQNNAGQLFTELGGITVSPNAGVWRVRFVTDAGIAQLFTRASAGLLVSNP